MVKNKISEISLDGGLLCLDFANSVANRKEDPLPDYLADIYDLITWARRTGAIDARTEKRMLAEAQAHPQKAAAFFRKALEFRELLYNMFRNISLGKKIPETMLEEYNEVLKKYLQHVHVQQSPNGFMEEWQLEASSFNWLLAQIVKDSYETLLNAKAERIKECGNCGWLFYDTTKNGSRRWCSMKSCGSSVKALEWYHRNKGKD